MIAPEKKDLVTRPTLYIDADACPVTAETLNVARQNKIPIVIVGNSTQNLGRHIKRTDPQKPVDPLNPQDSFWASTLSVGVGADAADFAIIQELHANDIVVTQDIGLAAMVLGRNAHAIGVRGRIYTQATIDMDMFVRHEEKKVRRQGGRTKGPSAFTVEDREHFSFCLKRLVQDALKAVSENT